MQKEKGDISFLRPRKFERISLRVNRTTLHRSACTASSLLELRLKQAVLEMERLKKFG